MDIFNQWSTWIEVVGYLASASVLVTFCMTTMIPLRLAGIVSNLLFASFGFLAQVYPVMLLHIVLLPVNIYRLRQIQRVVKGLRSMEGGKLTMESLTPYMTSRHFAAGDTLMRRGEQADRMFYLVKGSVQIRDFGRELGPGSILGEIGLFTPGQQRTATVVCMSDCDVMELKATRAKEIYFQDPAFGYALLQLIVGRLLENVEHAKAAPATASSEAGVSAGHEAPALT